MARKEETVVSPSSLEEALKGPVLHSETLLREQNHLRQALHRFLVQAAIPTGLYPGENPEDFSFFARRARQLLSRSPRTILRQAMENALKDDDDDDKSAEVQIRLDELRQLLGLNSDATLHDIGRSMDTMTQGKLYWRLQKIKEQLKRDQTLCSKEELKNRIYNGKMRKQKKKPPTKEEMDQMVDQAAAKKTKRLDRNRQCVVELEKQLLTDAEHQRFCNSNRIWQECGGKLIWENYKKIDLAISRNRNARGTRFEETSCDAIFTIIVSQLEKAKGINGSRAYHDYWYDRSVHFWHQNQEVGELDLVVYHKYRGVVAVCEMKSACFDIAIASRQHNVKLTAIASDTGNDWTIGKTVEESLSVSGEALPLFLATLLPGKEEEGILLGAEPLLIHAVSQGIRSQGAFIVDSSNLPLCRPIISLLKEDKPCVDEALAYLDSLPPNFDSSNNLNEVDYEQLRRYVLENSSPELFVESPLQCLERFANENVIVLPQFS